MTEPLVVDTSVLESGGATLQDLAFPALPAPLVVDGTDSVSAAINETLPVIETPVVEGLPAVKAALTRTGSSIAAAAGIYSDTDRRLGDHVNQVQFLATDENSAADTPAARLAAATTDTPADQPADDETPTPDPTLTPGSVLPQIGQYAQTAGYASQNAQTVMQSVQGAAGGMPGSGATPAQPVADTAKTEQSPADQAQLVDETNKADEEAPEPAEGAVPGDQTGGSVPVQPPTAGAPETTASPVEL